MERPHDYESLTTLDISNKKLKELPSWVSECKKLEILDCSRNNISSLDNLPPGLKELDCSCNQITSLDNLQLRLKVLYCCGNQITSLDYLPPELIQFRCDNEEWQKKYFTKKHSSRPL